VINFYLGFQYNRESALREKPSFDQQYQMVRGVLKAHDDASVSFGEAKMSMQTGTAVMPRKCQR
jgi:hypothetical protein